MTESLPRSTAPSERVSALLASMTLEEKLAQLVGFWVDKGDELVATMHMFPESVVSKEYTEATRDELRALVKTARFRAVRGENELYRDEGGGWTRWDPATQSWLQRAV